MVIENSNRLESRMLGIDPGLQCTGWGIVVQDGLKLTHLAHGTIRTEATWSFANRLDKIHNRLTEVIIDWRPDIASVEQIFVAKSAQSAMKLGMARGVAMQTCAAKGLTFREVSAKQVKKAVTGSGAAGKNQVSAMVEKLLNVKPKALDSADALAIAIAGINIGSGYAATYAQDYRKTPKQTSRLQRAIEVAIAKEQRR